MGVPQHEQAFITEQSIQAELIQKLVDEGTRYLKKYPKKTRGFLGVCPHRNQELAKELKNLPQAENIYNMTVEDLLKEVNKIVLKFKQVGELLENICACVANLGVSIQDPILKNIHKKREATNKYQIEVNLHNDGGGYTNVWTLQKYQEIMHVELPVSKVNKHKEFDGNDDIGEAGIQLKSFR